MNGPFCLESLGFIHNAVGQANSEKPNCSKHFQILSVHLLPGRPTKVSVKGKTTKSKANPVNIEELQSTIGKGDKTRTTFPETEVKTKEEPNNQRATATLLPAQIEPVGKIPEWS